MNDFSAKYLIKTIKVWENLIPFTRYQLDEEQIKLIIHKVPIKPFNCEEGLDILKNKIKSFNLNIKLIKSPNQLINEENKINKNHISIIIYLLN